MNNNFENDDTGPISLYDIDLNNIGFYFNLNRKEINNIKIYENVKNIEYIPNTYFYCGIIQCLANINPLRELFLNRHFLITHQLIVNTVITKKFYQIFQNIWYGGNNNQIYASLIPDINKENIFKDCKLLIQFLLLNMHNEQTKEKKENHKKFDFLIYNSIAQMRNDFYTKQTIIQKLFFFEVKKYNYCKECKNGNNPKYSINYVLEFQLEIIDDEITIYNLLDTLFQKEECEACNNKKSLQYGIKFNSCPLFLIIIIKHENEFEDIFKLSANIKLKNYITEDNHDSNEYELISFIKNPPIEEEKKKGIIFCKSPVNNEWYKYEEFKIEKTNINDIIRKEKNIPNLLIYMNKRASNININQLFGNN